MLTNQFLYIANREFCVYIKVFSGISIDGKSPSHLFILRGMIFLTVYKFERLSNQ